VTFTAVGGLIQSQATTFSLTPSTVGDFILLEITQFQNNSVIVTGVSSSNVTWAALGTGFAGSVNAGTASVWIGTVTSTSAATVTVAWNAATPTTIQIGGQEFSAGGAAVSLDVQGHIDSAGTNTWASLTPAASGELYFGYALNSAVSSAGSTSGYTYKIDSNGNGLAYNLNCAAGVGTAPVWGDSTQIFGIMVLAQAASSGPAVLRQPGSRTWRARFRRGQVPWPPPATVPAPPAQLPALLKGVPAAVKGKLTGVAAPPPVAAPPGSGPAYLPQPGSRTWRARFRRRQAPSAPLGPPPAAPPAPSPFFAPHTLLQGPAAAGRSELFHVEAPPPVRPGPPAPFHPPHLLLQGPAARVLARLTGARGRPGVPAPFTPPRLLSRGPAAAVKGRLTGLAAPPPVRHLTLGGFPLRGPAAAAKGTLSGLVAPPPVLHPVVVSTFKAPGFPLRGPAAARKGGVTGLVAPPPVTQPNVPSPFYPPHVPLRGPVPVTPRTKTTGGVAPPPAPPPLAPPHWQGSTHMIAATATGNLIQGANHTGRGGPGSDLKGDYERSGD
jgi:hypothetical protein